MRNRPIPQRNLKTKGLTLIELLVAISVLGFIAVLGWRGLDTIVRTRLALNKDLEQTRGMQLAFTQLENDCEHLVDPSLLPNRLPLAIGQGRLTLVRTVNADNQPTRLKVISYRVTEGNLIRQESIATRDLLELDRQWLTATNDLVSNSSENNPAVVLQEDVSSMAMRLWTNNSWLSGTMVPSVPTGTNNSASPSPPTGLEVTLQMRGHKTGMMKIFLLGAM